MSADRQPPPPAGDRPGDRPTGDEAEDSTWDEAAVDAELAADDGVLGVSLRALLEPSEGIERRTADTVDRTLRGRSALHVAVDLLGLGWRTVSTILTDDPPPADWVPEGNDDDH